jgi:hypothetical protein
MANGADLRLLAADLRDLAERFSDAKVADMLVEIGKASTPDIDKAVSGDIGDQSMSNWWRGKPVPIVGDYKVAHRTLTMQFARTSAGPGRVLESGRSAHAAGGTRNSGTYRSKRTGEVRQKTRKVKRTSGATRGKGTWTDAVRILEQKVPDRIEAAVLKTVGRLGR